ncbi:MAG: hypothetical protein O7G87_17795 [bacterium]|nr:hypothetical protein [bacterium]
MGWATSADAVVLTIRTASGDTAFFAAVGDTVQVGVDVDGAGTVLTGVEVFLRLDGRLFEVIDALPDPGFQVGSPGGLLGTVLADSLLVLSDSLSVIHYAEADLSGKEISGRLVTVLLRVIGSLREGSDITLYRNAAVRQISVYTVPSVMGSIFEFEGVRPLFYGNIPPVLLLPDTFSTPEDSGLVVDLDGLASDAESSQLVWQIGSSDTLVTVIHPFAGDSSKVKIVPAAHFHGEVQMTFAVTDAAGGRVEDVRSLQVISVNDAPQIRSGAIPDTVRLTGRNVVISLISAVEDVDDDLAGLSWSAQILGQVLVAIEGGQSLRFFAPLDWTGTEVIVVEVRDPKGASDQISVTVIRETALNVLPGDFDGNGVVAFPDFLSFVQVFGLDNPPEEADLDGDGKVDFADFLIFAQNFGRTSK